MKYYLVGLTILLVGCGSEESNVPETLQIEDEPVAEHIFSGQEKVLNDAKQMESFIQKQDEERRKKLEAMQ